MSVEKSIYIEMGSVVGRGIIVKMTSPGPILFSQKRLTKGMREFSIYKFRSMTSNEAREKNTVQIKGSSAQMIY
ncbi:MAG: sugar transferase [Cetobacterium sp.]